MTRQAKKKHRSNQSWIDSHVNDPYVKQAQKEGYRSRAVYKLLELQEKYHFVRPGMAVVDLGAAPGGWSQVAAKCVGEQGHVVAVDLLEMDAIYDVEFKQGDFTELEMQNWIIGKLNEAGKTQFDLVISDMAPNLSGVWVTDQARVMDLADRVWWFADENLAQGGSLLLKLFQGPGIDEYVKTLKQHFKKVIMRKPKASRAKSRECYCLAMDKK